ncbi:putative serine carboxypeptidase-like protein 23 [Tanacetum coccineum]
MLDPYTSCMCMECWGHGSFAHALIELEATVGLKDKLVVAIPKLKGSTCTMETIFVEYEWKLPRCDECKIIGHSYDNCPRMPSTSNTPAKARKQKDAQDEFLKCETEDKPVVKPNAVTPVSNVFFALEEDNEKPMDDLVADTRKKVEAPPKKTSIWSGRKADSPKRGRPPMNQGSKLIEFRLSQVQQWPNPVPESKPDMVTDHHSLAARIRESQSYANKEDHFLKEGLPGQPSSTLGLKQFAGNLAVDVMSGRSLFYYHVESQLDSASKPLVLWLNGGPGCSSVGLGAFTEIGPFGVNPDKTLYARKFAWNEVANMLFLESPASPQLNQGSKLIEFRLSHVQQRRNTIPESKPDMVTDHDSLAARIRESQSYANKEDHFLKEGLPGQPSSTLGLKQFAGNLAVDVMSGRSLFYYHVESQLDSASKPLVLWLNGGPGCSSVGLGAFTEIGPFGVNPDKTLYARKFAWNEVANMLFLESPASVGFSYSNTTSDYNIIGDKITAEDTLVFLMTWFAKYPQYKGRDFYLAGESYAGFYIPELAEVILNFTRDSQSTFPIINLKGFMIGNGLLEDVNDTIGIIDFVWINSLVSDETRQEYLKACSGGGFYQTYECTLALHKTRAEIGNVNTLNINEPLCIDPSSPVNVSTSGGTSVDVCDLFYVMEYLNLPQVQEALHANRTKLPYAWSPCYSAQHRWHDTPLNMFPIYMRLIEHNLSILLYSGEADACVPAIGTRRALAAMGLRIVLPWKLWSAYGTYENWNVNELESEGIGICENYRVFGWKKVK